MRYLNIKVKKLSLIISLVTFTYVSLWYFYSQQPFLDLFTKFSFHKNLENVDMTLGFDHIYVTNVSSRPGAHEKLRSIEKKLNLEFEFFPITKQFDDKDHNKLHLLQKAYVSNSIYQSIVDHNYKSALILEDDIDVELNIKSIMTDIHHILPINWEILYLGHCSNWEGKSGGPLPTYNRKESIYKLFKSKRPYCTHAYAVSYRGALKLLKNFTKLITPIDLELTKMITTNEISSYTIIPSVITRCLISDESTDLYPGKHILDVFSLKNSTLFSLGFNYELNNTLGFSHIYVLGLESRRDRREKLKVLEKKLNLKFEFFPAISQDDKKAFQELELKDPNLMPAQVACYLSHYKIYQSIIQRGYDSALILEDDVDFELNIASIISNTYRVLPSDWDVYYIGYCDYMERTGYILDGQSNSQFYKVHRSVMPVCTHGYAVSRAGILKLLEHLNPIIETVDSTILRLMRAGTINSFSLVPLAMVQWRSSINPSDIAPEFRFHYFISLQHSALEHFGLIKETNNTLGFNKIYFINYQDEPDYQNITEKLTKMSDKLCLVFTNFDSISSSEISKINQKNKLKESQKVSYLSHFKVYKSIINYGYGSALILEGDMDIELRITSIMVDIHRILPADWDIIYLGYCNNSEGTSGEPLPGNNNNQFDYKLFKSDKPHCTFAYAVSYAGALKLVEKLGNSITSPLKPLDIELVNMIQSGTINSYTLVPPIIANFRKSHSGKDISDIHLKNSTIEYFKIDE
ncbi:9428_t:CDS:1 [Cetraspora pellucida]|uniref:9428_t:CDS:1 n=1 Tax=Cetraspora pellucida TaxID=1433469 RepID=A0ACA9KIT3_9GLOM|nr:9428_t:CDS:1 [Cetraspora pellucida]